MMLRSLLFVPADRPERFAKAVASGADAIIIDLEDSVAALRKAEARVAVTKYLSGHRQGQVFVRINAMDSGFAADDLGAVLPFQPDGIVLPKSEGAHSVRALLDLMGNLAVPILPIATETPGAVFELGTYVDVGDALAGLTWGAEDLPAVVGAITDRDANGHYTPPYELVRSLTLFGAYRAGVQAIETVYANFADERGLADHLARARRDGFTAMMAIHPAQVSAINSAFTPSGEEIAQAKRIVALFAANSAHGAQQLDGRMLDLPHLKSAKALLQRAGET